jgi:hypothetical protein
VQYCLPTLSEPFYIWLLPYLTPFTLPLIHIALTGSVYSVVAVALERFMTVCYPFRQCKVRASQKLEKLTFLKFEAFAAGTKYFLTVTRELKGQWREIIFDHVIVSKI